MNGWGIPKFFVFVFLYYIVKGLYASTNECIVAGHGLSNGLYSDSLKTLYHVMHRPVRRHDLSPSAEPSPEPYYSSSGAAAEPVP
jgi:hypothetical protein